MIWCRSALVGGQFRDAVSIGVDGSGRIDSITCSAPVGDSDLRLGSVAPGFVNTHSHLFHRALRGSVIGDDFWSWRDAMYRLAAALDPDTYYELARGVYAEMVAAGYTGVGEFHYLHHAPDGRRYPGHAMEQAVAHAAIDAGIRLVLLDTCYLHGGIGAELSPAQKRFGDGTATAWIERWHDLRDVLPSSPLVRLGAALHSVRALTPTECAAAVAGLPDDVPLHVHVSEQRRENEECLDMWGISPTQLLAEAGAASPRSTFVHATHISDADIALITQTGVTVSLCPTTEADLGDGIARISELIGARVPLSIGSDQNVVSDPFAEMRLLEATARLGSGRRGVLTAGQLWLVGTLMGQVSLYGDDAESVPGLRVGDWADLVEIDESSTRLAGVDPLQWPLTATADDVAATIVGGAPLPRRDGSGLRAALAGLREAAAA